MYRKTVSLLLIGSLCCTLVHASQLPAGITKCSIEDENCLREGVNYVLKNHAKTGVKDLGLGPLDPLRVKKFSLGKNPKSPVSIDLTFSNAELIGLGGAHVTKISRFTRDASRDIHIELLTQQLVLKGPYKVEGKVLILPIHGDGDAVIVLDKCKVRALLKLHAVSKGPKQTYAQVQEVKMQLEPALVSYKLSNLFNGMKAPSDAFHILVNENWKEIFNELQVDISTATGLIFKSLLNRALSKLPLEELFTDV